jgi:class 3 adenylate cyclase
MAPETRYARNGDIHIAYQVVGDGPLDLVYVPTWMSQVEHLWEDPRTARFLSRLAGFSRLILFDRRGSGLSDGTGAAPTLEEQVDDVEAVLSAAQARDPALLSVTDGGAMAALFAATRPQSVRALALYAPIPRFAWAPDYEWPGSAEEREARVQGIIEAWGRGVYTDIFAPSSAGDERLREWFARLERLSMAPGAAARYLDMLGRIDVRELLPSIQCPTLVLHRADDQLIDPRHSRYVADHVPGARYVEMAGRDNLVTAGDTGAIIDEVEEFLTGTRRPAETDRVLATVLFTDIVGSTERAASLGDRAWRELLAAHDDVVRAQIERFRGQPVKSLGDGWLATFDGPARAVRAALAIRDALGQLGLEARAGLHTGECEVLPGDVGGMAVHIGARVSALAGAGEVCVSSTVKDLVVGSGLEFAPRGTHELRGVPGEWAVYRADG